MKTEAVLVREDQNTILSCESCWGLKSILDREYADVTQFRLAISDLCAGCEASKENQGYPADA